MPPDDAEQLIERGRELRQGGRLADAVALLRRALARAPGEARAWNELAHALRWDGQLDEARDAAERAIRIAPALAQAWFNLGAVRIEQGDAAGGIDAYRRALAIDADFAEAWSNLGEALGLAGDAAGEIAAYRRAVASGPDLAPAWSNLGAALQEAEETEEALAACRRAVELDPVYARGWSHLGNVLRERGVHGEAVAACERAAALTPADSSAWSNLGCALLEQGDIERSLDAHQRALAIAPGDARALYNLGIAQERARQYDSALEAYRRSVEREPAFAPARVRLASVLLLLGRFDEGWREYEWRWRDRRAPRRRYEFASWSGEREPARRLLLWGEQGVGDEIIHSSMIDDLAGTPLAITLEVDPRLVPLMRRSFGGIEVVARADPPAVDSAAFSWQAPLGSLGCFLRPSFDAFPRRAYLRHDARRAAGYAAKLRGPAAAPLVGISWRSANRDTGADKSMALADWEPILRVPGARFVDLQYGDTRESREWAARAGIEILHLDDLDLFNDLDGLAALCAACDVIITASNVTAHLAGSLGKAVWLLAPCGNGRIWYWFAGHRDSPWYPALRVFEQDRPGVWQHALNAAAEALEAFGARGGPRGANAP